MIRKITADWVYPISQEPIREGVVVMDGSGKILAVDTRAEHDPASLDVRQGMLIPGFINTHCHLELSHMKGMIATGTGLIPFITGVVTQRNQAVQLIAEAIQRAEEEMLAGGIVAVGDISNAVDTFKVKAEGRLRYHTFVEIFDFLQETGTEKAMADGQAVYDQLEVPAGSVKTMVPHAPYSVSPDLFQKINAINPPAGATVSIHNQETPDENALFRDKTGSFPEFYSRFGLSTDHFEPGGTSSIYYAIRHLNPANRTLFVHNTLTTREEIEAAQSWSPNVYWATCPNANLYIENRLPCYRHFLDAGARLTVGTDSLTSNWQLSILEELKAIARFQSYVPLANLLRWATLNGAEALGFDDTLGSLEVGKTPGLLLLQGLEGERLTQDVTVQHI